jgi:hypothetical protein
MFRRALLGVIAGFIILTGTMAALAQDYPLDYSRGPHMGWSRGAASAPPEDGALLPPRAIVGSLFRRGYRDVQIKRVRGDSYIAEARLDGGLVLVVVDGHTTEITGLRRIGWDHPPRQWDDDDWSPPRPWSGPRW